MVNSWQNYDLVDNVINCDVYLTRLLVRPQPQMYLPVALNMLNQYTWVNRTHKKNVYMLQGPMKTLK